MKKNNIIVEFLKKCFVVAMSFLVVMHETLVSGSFLSRYPSDTDNQIYPNSKTRNPDSILLVLISCTASFQICLSILLCVHECFANFHLIAPRKISNFGGLSLVSS